MRVLDLFAGLRGWSDPWAKAGHETLTLDLDPSFGCDIVADILDVGPDDFPWRPHVILASPPCEGFSVMQIGRNWTGPKDDPPNAPKTEKAETAWKIVEHTLWLIREIQPVWWVMENPVAKLRRVMETYEPDVERRKVHYCTLGEERMKPTDLWGGFPPSLKLPTPCRTDRTAFVVVNGREFRINQNTGKPCHLVAVRGSVTGTQGMDSAEAAKIPARLSNLVRRASERDLEAMRQDWLKRKRRKR